MPVNRYDIAQVPSGGLMVESPKDGDYVLHDDYTRLELAARRVRDLQRAYFKVRTREALIASKAAEDALDRLLGPAAAPAQGELAC